MFALVTTTQLIIVIFGVLTTHLIWNNPADCPEKYLKLEQGEQRKVCELKKYGYNSWSLVLKE